MAAASIDGGSMVAASVSAARPLRHSLFELWENPSFSRTEDADVSFQCQHSVSHWFALPQFLRGDGAVHGMDLEDRNTEEVEFEA